MADPARVLLRHGSHGDHDLLREVIVKNEQNLLRRVLESGRLTGHVLADEIRAALQDEPTADLASLLREVLEADDSNVDTATTLPYDLTDRIRSALNQSEPGEPQCRALGGHNWEPAEQGHEYCAICQNYRRAVNRK